MSTDSPTAVDPTPEAEPDRLHAWLSNLADDQLARRCQGCGAHVTARFRRQAGDENGNVHACPACVTGTDLVGGVATGLEPDRVVDADSAPLRGGQR